MQILESSTNPRIADLVNTMREMSLAAEPENLLGSLGRMLRRWIHSDAMIAVSKRGLPGGQYKITRQIWYNERSDESSTWNPWRDWAKLPAHTGGFIGEIINGREPEVFHDLDLSNDPVLGQDYSGFGSCMVIPVFDRGYAVNWSFSFRDDPKGFSLEDLELTLLISNLVGRATKNLIMARELESLNLRVHQDLERVADIQRALLPDKLPDIPGLEVATYYRPCELAGGDYFDFTPLERLPNGETNPDGRWGFLIADVSGHGASAAVIMAMMQALVHAYPDMEELTSDRLLSHLNTQLVRKRLDHNFVTAFTGAFCPQTRHFYYACAGHYPPRLKKPGTGSPVIPLRTESGLPLGIDHDIRVQQHMMSLEPGDTIVMFTDGVIESFNRDREMFGMERLDQAMHDCSGAPACIIDSITAALAEHEGEDRPADDQTIVALRVLD